MAEPLARALTNARRHLARRDPVMKRLTSLVGRCTLTPGGDPFNILVRSIVSREMPELGEIAVETSPSDDLRSYHVSSEKIKRELGWTPKRTIEDAVVDLCKAFRAGKLAGSLTDVKYFNVKAIQSARLGVPAAV